MNSRTPWWDAKAFAARAPRLAARARIVKALRGYFEGAGFTEVETPALQLSPGMEPHLRAFATQLHEPFGGGARAMYLHTSPEFAMKKLLAAGMPRIFQLAHVFRDGERAPAHHPEFTMLEWYRAGAGVPALIADCAEILRAAWGAVPADLRGGGAAFFSDGRAERGGEAAFFSDGRAERGAGLCRQGKVCDPARGIEVLTVADAFARYAGLDILATAPDPENPDAERLRAAAKGAGIALPETGDWEDLFFHIFLDRIEPHLGIGAPTALTNYPLSMAALARPSPDDPRTAARVELYVAGLELANGFDELTDAAEQRRRFARDREKKRRLYGAAYPMDEDFLDAVGHMPQAAGMALGLDRLVMLATGAETIEDVLWAPVG